jgi:hypothetical protein
MEVPEIVFVAVSELDHAAVTPEPGAKILVQVPKLEKLERVSPCCMAFTVYAPEAEAGEKLHLQQDKTRHDTTRHDTTRHDTTRHDTTV